MVVDAYSGRRKERASEREREKERGEWVGVGKGGGWAVNVRQI